MKTQLELFFAKCKYNKATVEFLNLPFLKKLFTKRPADPSPKGAYTLFDEFIVVSAGQLAMLLACSGAGAADGVLCRKRPAARHDGPALL